MDGNLRRSRRTGSGNKISDVIEIADIIKTSSQLHQAKLLDERSWQEISSGRPLSFLVGDYWKTNYRTHISIAGVSFVQTVSSVKSSKHRSRPSHRYHRKNCIIVNTLILDPLKKRRFLSGSRNRVCVFVKFRVFFTISDAVVPPMKYFLTAPNAYKLPSLTEVRTFSKINAF